VPIEDVEPLTRIYLRTLELLLPAATHAKTNPR